jgi:threonyl-tRNA synthetase
MKSVIKINDDEIDLLRDLAVRLYEEGSITKYEAIGLLKLASRARPDGSYILSKIDELRKA